MSPAMLAIIVQLIEQLITEAPAVYAEFQVIFSKPNPTPADWAALKAKVASESFQSLAPDAPLS